MPRTRLRGSQILDRSIEADDLAIDSVITEKIKDHNVTCEKLEVGLCDRLLRTDSPILRVQIDSDIPAGTDFSLPGTNTYSVDDFIDRVAIYRNGQLLYNGLAPPVDWKDPIEVYPGSDNGKVKFDFDLERGATIQFILY